MDLGPELLPVLQRVVTFCNPATDTTLDELFYAYWGRLRTFLDTVVNGGPERFEATPGVRRLPPLSPPLPSAGL